MTPLRFLLVLTLSSCVTTSEGFRNAMLQRVQFEANCPVEKIEVSTLVDHGGCTGSACHGSQVGVSACGKRMIYVNTSLGWVLQSN